MIPQAAITHWRNVAPWPQDAQVEQDLILCRALVEIFSDLVLAKALFLRGGTALHKLFVTSPHRYSEDIDLVQISAGPIGSVLDALRARLDPILGKPRRENSAHNVTLRYRMESEIAPIVPLRLKIEINTREHFAVFEAADHPFSVRSPWFEGRANVRSYALDELLATKLRALYQRRKGRDLFDLWLGLGLPGVDAGRIVEAFRKYMKAEGNKVSQSEFQKNLDAKIASRQFGEDLSPLLAPAIRYDVGEAARIVTEKLLSRL